MCNATQQDTCMMKDHGVQGIHPLLDFMCEWLMITCFD